MRYLDLNTLPEVYPHYPFAFKRFTKDEVYVTRTPEFDTLILVFEGTLSFLENGKRIDISTGQYYIQAAGTMQTGVKMSGCPMYFFSHFIGTHLSSGGDTSMPEFGNFNIAEMKERCGRLFLHNNTSLLEKTLFFYSILERLKQQNQTNSGSIATAIEQYISANIVTVSSLEDLCRQFNYSKDHIIRLFRNEYHMTPHRYIVTQKIRYAADLLKETNLSVSQISEQCGYSDKTVFFRAFKSVTGLSPMNFRKKR